ncbi:alpha/beta fold hydrolase [Stieleria sp. JC731]|uniref:esterase/lipase family protein n=1 Tax=Pirellulaceae TaxID=2691357 RepID=UPI001E59ACF8|nr:alpha/beta fold hydrolase [Stieleria sp. JC731]MCC9602308.1 alpha/beta fold hydrolase [Stieleria sp. JC731]
MPATDQKQPVYSTLNATVNRPHASLVLCILLLQIACSGCSTVRYLSPRDVRENPLTASLRLMNRSGPHISDRTWNTLRRYGLREGYTDDSSVCLQKIQQTIRENRDPELIHSLAELSYVEGKKAESDGRESDALAHFGVTLTNSYDYLFSEELSQTRNHYDPQFRETCDLYNESLEDTLRLLCKERHIKPGQSYRVKANDQEFVIQTQMRGKWSPDEFDHYEFVSDYEIQTLRSKHTTFGLGVPMIAVRKSDSERDPREKYYPEGLSYAVTAMMRCTKPEDGEGGANTCVLEFFDPLKANQVKLANHWVPLETDLTTPLAFFLDTPRFRERNQETEGLINPAGATKNRGVYMLEPYDPNRIPVLMVHGLWSSPRTWMDMFNDLRSFAEIRERYQFWFYLYPSGQPFWISATQLRSDLQDLRQTFDPMKRDAPIDQMVLVGHSMGGLVSRMQTIDSGDDFWRIVSDQPKEKLHGEEQQRDKLVSTLYFQPNQSVKRVITIGTPHRGSRFANDVTRWLARKVIKLPKINTATGETLVDTNPNFFRDTELLTMANAIDSLAPESPIFPVMMRAKYSPEVHYHNIIGVLSDPTLIQKKVGRGDGVVAYDSATMADTESELVVDAEHTKIHMTGQAIFEVRRILLDHLREIDSKDRIAVLPSTESPAASSDVERPEVLVSELY